MRANPLPSMLLLLAGVLMVACASAQKEPPPSFTPLLMATPLPTSDVADLLADAGARPWQVAQVAPLISVALA